MTETDLSLYAVGTLTDEEAREAVAWRYDGEYAVYNFPSWDECAARGCTTVRLAVRTFNTRAVRCYEHAGFRIIDKRCEALGTAPGEMYIMQTTV